MTFYHLPKSEWLLAEIKEKHEEDKMYCSEFVSWVYNLDDSYRTSPKDFLDYCLKNNWEEIYNTGVKYN